MSHSADSSSIHWDARIATRVGSLLFVTTSIGVVGMMEWTDELETIVTWLWIGIGLSIVYLLFVVARSVQRLESRS